MNWVPQLLAVASKYDGDIMNAEVASLGKQLWDTYSESGPYVIDGEHRYSSVAAMAKDLHVSVHRIRKVIEETNLTKAYGPDQVLFDYHTLRYDSADNK